ncbi:MAG: PAS domain S-box protein [Hyphomicrobiaceae bacterium]|nr:MAG: PAS domain S-box protein [Hyphomicrobiaceae bacterium]
MAFAGARETGFALAWTKYLERGHWAAVLDRQVHPMAWAEPLLAERHRSFILAHWLGAAVSLATFLLYFIAVRDVGIYAVIALGWFLSPALIALLLSRTGRLGLAHLLSAGNLIGLVALASVLTGGINSFVLVWMVLVPLEAALSSSRRTVIISSTAAVLTLAALHLVTKWGLLPQQIETPILSPLRELFTHFAAVVYAGGLALSVERIHRRTQAEIEGERERYRLLAENATDMITRHDSSGTVLFASPAGAQLLGIKPGELIGDGLFERVLVSDRPSYLSALSTAARAGAASSAEFRLACVAGDGARPVHRWVEMRCRPVIAKNGASGNEVVAVTRDIEDRKRQETNLEQARSAAERASRAKTLFLANMSHELRTPLNAILGFSDILRKDLMRKAEEQRNADYCRIINESGEHLLQVVNHLLDMSKIESGNYRLAIEPFVVTRVVESCIETVRPAAERKAIEIVTSLPADLPELDADRRACKQMLLNLLANAVKFTGENGRIEVSARTEGANMRLKVRDNGIGISADDIVKLGEPFVQAENGYRRRHEGTGLGLSVVKGLARLHGGDIEIESEINKGTAVSIVIPLLADEGSANESAPAMAHAV